MKHARHFFWISLLFFGALEAQAGGLAPLLTSSAWCSFKYSQVTGYSNSTRYRFNRNGTYSMGSRGEGYSSGGGGTFASQHDGGSGGRWKVEGERLFLSDDGVEWESVATRVKSNSNGNPIIVADGVEYSQCN
ncbi:MAG TPA: hypothetical protein VJR29_00720 [bacterium]|nr:hypothetical protein [bacterium]